MKSNKKYHLLPFLIFLCFVLLYCSRNSPIESITLTSSSEQWFDRFEIQHIDNLVVSNRIGPISIYGNGLPDTLRAYLYKSVYAETKKKATEHFGDIVLQHYVTNDSAICSITAPHNTNRFEYYCALDLELYGNLLTYIKSPNYGVTFFYMDTTIYVQDSSGDIEIKKHNGSCEVKTSKGDILTEMIIKNKGFCRCYTSEGNIIIEIPSNTSATIYARADEGVVSYGNLTISNLHESKGLLIGELSEGNGEIRLETKKGDIEIKGLSITS
ncbi:MAG: DUF4097 family beta strand repeat protein [Tissierellales bacterium]|nr:DUF4097 family beta strand repeat protein [Tissierellales bacterium]